MLYLPTSHAKLTLIKNEDEWHINGGPIHALPFMLLYFDCDANIITLKPHWYQLFVCPCWLKNRAKSPGS